MTKYLIIGNSAAAIGAVEGIRQKDIKGGITILSKEKYHTYSRPLISYLLQGKTDLNRMKYRPDSFYIDNNVNFINDEAKSISVESKKVYTQKGNYNYEKLLIATGSKPFIPHIEGMDGVKNKFTFMSLDDALELGKELNSQTRILIIGGGLIGLKCAEAVAKRVQSVTVTDISDRIMPSVLDKECARIVQQELENNGIKFILDDCIRRFENNMAFTVKGIAIEFDILIIAAGVRPNTQIFDKTGDVDKGIVIDDMCRTSSNSVYAAGDCTLSYDITAKTRKVLALLPNAYMQGFSAGMNMAGGNMPYKGAFAINSIGFFGYHIITAGSMIGESVTMREGENYKRLFYEEDVLKGFIICGDIQKAGIYTSLIREHTPLSQIDFELMKHNPTIAALGLDKVKRCLGEEV